MTDMTEAVVEQSQGDLFLCPMSKGLPISNSLSSFLALEMKGALKSHIHLCTMHIRKKHTRLTFMLYTLSSLQGSPLSNSPRNENDHFPDGASLEVTKIADITSISKKTRIRSISIEFQDCQRCNLHDLQSDIPSGDSPAQTHRPTFLG
jgi:hypothetical protein